ncbi:MAG TPA: DNA primase [Solirubrobacteraceae bacterium]|nr:DNA primase [Solirubrobacteraceae bacterium]
MTRYAPDSRDRVFDAVDMVALVSARTELRRAGVNSYFGNCPFHDERTGSFHVSPDEKLYHCFGCQASGDAFSFVQETEGLDFKGALESLASRFGVALEAVDEDPRYAERRRHDERLYELMNRTAAYYARLLWESAEAEEARRYLAARGLAEETLRDFRVGYAPGAWDRILTASRRAGFTDAELAEVGLVRRSERSRAGAYDFFREQIMFPAADARGRVHGFGARRMREDQSVAKYVNTPDGRLYHKREVLFGIDRARASAAKAGRMILVEGYTDVLALHQAGIENVVGIMGTSFTEEQLVELMRVVTTLELCLDADSAGQEAMLRAARMATGRGVELRVVVLPEGADPADLALSEGPEALRERVAGSIPFVSFDVERILRTTDISSAEGRDRALAELAPAFVSLPPSVLRDQLLQRVSGMLELSDARLQSLLERPPASDGPRGSERAGNRREDGIGRRGGAARGPARGGALIGPSSGGGMAGPSRGGHPAHARPSRGGYPTHTADAGGGHPAHAARSPRGSAPGTQAERIFLALCIAMPDAGTAALAGEGLEALFTSHTLRQAALHLRSRTRAPLSELPAEDEEFARVMSGLVELAGRVPDPSADRLEHARLVLVLDRLERALLRARAEGEGTSEIAQEREGIRSQLHEVVSRLEGTL